MSVQVSLEDNQRNIFRQAKLVENVPISRLTPAIVASMGLPLTDDGTGRPIVYSLEHNRRQLQNFNSLSEAGVQNGDTILIVSNNLEENSSVEDISTQLDDLKREIISQLNNSSPVVELSAPVELPPQEEMKVKLAPTHLFSRWEEEKTDQNYWLSSAWCFSGTALGLLINLVTTGATPPTTNTILTLFLLFAMSFLSFFAANKHSKRGRLIKDSITKEGKI